MIINFFGRCTLYIVCTNLIYIPFYFYYCHITLDTLGCRLNQNKLDFIIVRLRSNLAMPNSDMVLQTKLRNWSGLFVSIIFKNIFIIIKLYFTIKIVYKTVINYLYNKKP